MRKIKVFLIGWENPPMLVEFDVEVCRTWGDHLVFGHPL